MEVAERDKVSLLVGQIWDQTPLLDLDVPEVRIELARRIRAELKPLLDAAERSTEDCGDHCRNSCLHCGLAAEVQGWRKEK